MVPLICHGDYRLLSPRAVNGTARNITVPKEVPYYWGLLLLESDYYY